MKTLLSLSSILCLVVSLELGIHKEKHQVSDQCCVAKKGKICGKYLKDCCRSDCESGMFGSRWCKEGDEYEPDCQTCTQVCKSKGGISCMASIMSKKITCCPSENCKLPSGSDEVVDKAMDKFIDTATDKAVNTLKGSEQKHSLFDTSGYFQKFDQMTVNGQCQEGTEIQLSKCIEDSFGALIIAKLFG